MLFRSLAIKTKSEATPTDELVIKAINKELKELNQTLSTLAGKEDSALYADTKTRIGVLTPYLPTMITGSELDTEIDKVLTAIDATTNFGIKMKTAMQALKGKANNADIKTSVERYK